MKYKSNTVQIKEDIRRLGVVCFAIGVAQLFAKSGSIWVSVFISVIGLLAIYLGTLEVQQND